MGEFTYTPEIIRKLQLVELDMLRELDRICRENDIRYIISSGTLLGAVRSGAFIPWDDDIDVSMLRDDYEKFCDVCSTQLDAKYFLQNHKTDPGYRWGYSRILKNGTVYKRKDHGQMKSRTGIFIDVFPYDKIPEKGFWKGYCSCLSWICRKALYSEIGCEVAGTFIRRTGFAFLNLFPKKMFYGILEHLTRKFKDLKKYRVRCFCWGAREESIGFDKEFMEDTCDIMFEGYPFEAPVKYREYLVFTYGEDYMTPPAEDKRVPGHIADDIDFGGQELFYG